MMLLLQAATIALFAAGVVDANTATPVATPVTYSSPLCGQVRLPESPPPILNPAIVFWDETAPTECRVTVTPQVAALPVGSGYTAAVKIGTGLYGPPSTAFSVSAAQVPTIIAGQPFTVRAPHDCANATAYRLYLDGAQAGADLPLSACASGMITAASSGVPAGSHTAALAAVDAVGELRGPALTFQATAPRTTAPGLPTVTQP